LRGVLAKQNLVRKVGLFALLVALATLNGSPCMAGGSAQGSNPRYGRWKLKSDAASPSSNIMTYEPFGGKGMKITIDAVNGDGVKSIYSLSLRIATPNAWRPAIGS